MIEEKIEELFALNEKHHYIKEEVLSREKDLLKYNAELSEILRELYAKKAELGELLAPLKENILYEKDGKKYCIAHNKNNIAFIILTVSPKEAEIKLSLIKLGAEQK